MLMDVIPGPMRGLNYFVPNSHRRHFILVLTVRICFIASRVLIDVNPGAEPYKQKKCNKNRRPRRHVRPGCTQGAIYSGPKNQDGNESRKPDSENACNSLLKA